MARTGISGSDLSRGGNLLEKRDILPGLKSEPLFSLRKSPGENQNSWAHWTLRWVRSARGFSSRLGFVRDRLGTRVIEEFDPPGTGAAVPSTTDRRDVPPLALGVCSWSLQVTSVAELSRLLDELGVNVTQIACGDPHHASWEEGDALPEAARASGS